MKKYIIIGKNNKILIDKVVNYNLLIYYKEILEFKITIQNFLLNIIFNMPILLLLFILIYNI